MLEDRNPDGSFVPARLDQGYPVHFWGVLVKALDAIPKNSWVILDTEGADSYCPDESRDHAHNIQAFINWQYLVKAVRQVRPDVKIAANLMWHHQNLAYKPNWTETTACDKLFQTLVNPLIDALCIEGYFYDWASPPSPSVANSDFNFNDIRFGFVSAVAWSHLWARTVSGKPAVHLISLCYEWASRPEMQNRFLPPDVMQVCLNVIRQYDPAAICFWGVASQETPFRCPDGYVIGTFNTNINPLLAVISNAMKQA